MTDEDRSWQIEQFETFFLSKRLFPQLRWQRPRQMARRSLTKHWSQERTDRWSFANEFLCSASSKHQKAKINLTFQMIGRYSCPTNVCVIHNSQPPFYSANSHTYQQPHSSSSTTTTLSSSSPSSTSSSSRLVHVAQSVYTLAHISPSTHWASKKYCLVLA